MRKGETWEVSSRSRAINRWTSDLLERKAKACLRRSWTGAGMLTQLVDVLTTVLFMGRTQLGRFRSRGRLTSWCALRSLLRMLAEQLLPTLRNSNAASVWACIGRIQHSSHYHQTSTTSKTWEMLHYQLAMAHTRGIWVLPSPRKKRLHLECT